MTRTPQALSYNVTNNTMFQGINSVMHNLHTYYTIYMKLNFNCIRNIEEAATPMCNIIQSNNTTNAPVTRQNDSNIPPTSPAPLQKKNFIKTCLDITTPHLCFTKLCSGNLPDWRLLRVSTHKVWDHILLDIQPIRNFVRLLADLDHV